MNIKNNRKLKYGSLAVTITCVCVALIVVFNAIFFALAQRFGWYVDMTQEQLFELSDSCIELLDGYREMEGFEIKMIFCQEPDLLDGSYYTRILHTMVKQFQDEFNFIDVEYVNIELHPGAVEKYKRTSADVIDKTSLIIACGEASRVYSLKSFFVTEQNSSTVIAFDGEFKITSAIMSLSGDNPIAYFTTGHSEDVQNSSMYTLFEDAGFTVKTIDLSKETPDENAMVIVINNPKYDFMGAEQSVNEIQKLDTFLDGMGNMMVFLDTDADASRFTELNELLSEWGLMFEDAHIYDYSNSLTQDGTELVAEYVTDDKFGASLTTSLRKLEEAPKIIIKNARPIKALFTTSPFGTRYTSSVLTTSSQGTAVAVPFGASSNSEGTPGVYDLMMVSAEIRFINNVECYNYVMCAGTASFADDQYIGSSIYGNRDLIFYTMQAFGKKAVPIDLDFKMFDTEGLDLTSAQANLWTVILSVVLPSLVFAAGIVVFIRRRQL